MLLSIAVPRIKKTLPETLWALLPLDPTPVCLYLDQPDAVSKKLQSIAGELDVTMTDEVVSKA